MFTVDDDVTAIMLTCYSNGDKIEVNTKEIRCTVNMQEVHNYGQELTNLLVLQAILKYIDQFDADLPESTAEYIKFINPKGLYMPLPPHSVILPIGDREVKHIFADTAFIDKYLKEAADYEDRQEMIREIKIRVG